MVEWTMSFRDRKYGGTFTPNTGVGPPYTPAKIQARDPEEAARLAKEHFLSMSRDAIPPVVREDGNSIDMILVSAMDGGEFRYGHYDFETLKGRSY